MCNRVYVDKICDDKFGGCKKSFSWLGQKVNKTIDVFGHDADDLGTDLCPRPRDDIAPRQDISTLFNILIKFEATEYSYLIGYLIRIRNFEGIRLE